METTETAAAKYGNPVAKPKAPLKALDEIFDFDGFDSHLELLEQWRNAAINDGFFQDRRGCPLGALSVYRNTLDLIDAMNALKESEAFILPPSTTLEKERETWIAFPHLLSQEELTDPGLAARNFFASISREESFAQLNEWLEAALAVISSNDYFEINRFVLLYEQLRKLYSAAWVMHQRSSPKPYLKKECKPDHMPEVISDVHITVHSLNSDIQSAERKKLLEVVSVIRKLAPSVSAVYHLGVSSAGERRINILVLVPDGDISDCIQLACNIEQCCGKTAPVHALVHHQSIVASCSKINKAFLTRALSCPLLYLSGMWVPPNIAGEGKIASMAQVDAGQQHIAQGKRFLNAANPLMQGKDGDIALMMLSLSAERVLFGLNLCILGYHTATSNLSRLLRISEMYTWSLSEILLGSDETCKTNFALLKDGVISVRHRPHASVDEQVLTELAKKVAHMVKIADKLLNRYISVNTL